MERATLTSEVASEGIQACRRTVERCVMLYVSVKVCLQHWSFGFHYLFLFSYISVFSVSREVYKGSEYKGSQGVDESDEADHSDR